MRKKKKEKGKRIVVCMDDKCMHVGWVGCKCEKINKTSVVCFESND